jgi:hypothetical protein
MRVTPSFQHPRPTFSEMDIDIYHFISYYTYRNNYSNKGDPYVCKKEIFDHRFFGRL